MAQPSHTPLPPAWADRFIQWICPTQLQEELLGDLHEQFEQQVAQLGESRARRRYIGEVIRFCRPYFISRQLHAQMADLNPYSAKFFLHPTMLRNYLKIAWRTLAKNKGYSTINIGGLAVGMAVAMLIGLWIYDELSFDKYFQNYSRIAQVMQRGTFNGEFGAGGYMPVPLGDELRTAFADDFQYVVMSSWTGEHILANNNRKFTRMGNFLSPEAPDMLTLIMRTGTRAGLRDPNSILLSESTAQSLFGNANPLGKIIRIDNNLSVAVTGVYEDLPENTQFADIKFIAPWALYVSSNAGVKRAQENMEWDNNSWQILAQLRPNADFDAVTEKIKGLRVKHIPQLAKSNTEVFLNPMSRWHLYTGWDKTGKLEGRIQYIWLFGFIGGFVLLLACINFMNLSTARSEKRAKEVGIRKAVGSIRTQLITQFLGESLLVVSISFVFALILVLAALPFFNQTSGKNMALPWKNLIFWLGGLGFSLITGLIAGSYPALYLSGFQPVKILKGTFRAGRFAAIPRRVLVVLQFAVSVTLIIGTITVFRQVQYAKNRPVGYDRNGLITVAINTPELQQQYNSLRSELLETGAVVEMSTSSTPTTKQISRNGGFEWAGKDPDFNAEFGTVGVSHDFGKTVGWQFKQGRDFSRAFTTDSAGMVINQTAADYMGLKNPVGKTVRWKGKSMQIVGVVKDMVMSSPFEPIRQTVFMLDYGWASVINIKLNPVQSAAESLAKVEGIFRKLNPGSPFDYTFIDQQYALKFAAEERIGKLASVFAILAILISCLGLLGLASFMAEQRTKEIGVRKVLGASVANVWALLSREFVVLVLIGFGIATPIASYLLGNWLQKYEYRTDLSWWIFAVSGVGALLLTLLTVSYQSIKAALVNPVKSLRSE